MNSIKNRLFTLVLALSAVCSLESFARPCDKSKACFSLGWQTPGEHCLSTQFRGKRKVGGFNSKALFEVNGARFDDWISAVSKDYTETFSYINPRTQLQEGNNTIIKHDFANICSTSIIVNLVYHPPESQSIPICSAVVPPGAVSFSCNKTYQLKEVDESLVIEIQRYRAEAEAHRKRATDIIHEEEEAKARKTDFRAKRVKVEQRFLILRQEASKIRFSDFDLIDPTKMVQLILEDPSIRKRYDEFKKSVDELRDALKREVATNATRTAQVELNLGALFKNVIPPAQFMDLPPDPTEGVGLKEGAFPANPGAGISQSQVGPFLKHTLKSLESALERGDQDAFLRGFSAWKAYQEGVKGILEKRPNAGPELEGLASAQEKVLAFVQKHVDLYGFFNSANIPEQARILVGTQIRQWNEQVAQDLRDELNQWRGDLNPTQNRVSNQIIEFGNALARLSDARLHAEQKDPAQDQARNILDAALTVSAEQLLYAARKAPESRDLGGLENPEDESSKEPAVPQSPAEEALLESQTTLKIAVAMGDFLLGLTPLGGVKDLVEGISGISVLSGESLTLPERSLVLVTGTLGIVPGVKVALTSLKGLVSVGKRLKTVLSKARGVGRVEGVIDIGEAAAEAERIIDSAGKFLKRNPTSDEVSWYANLTRKAGSKESAEVLSREISILSKELRFTETTAKRMETRGRFVPKEMLAEAVKTGIAVLDPQGAVGATKYTIDMFKNGRKYQLEVIFREADKTILHFLYK